MSWLSPARWLAVLALCAGLVAGYVGWRGHQREIGRAEVRTEYAALALQASEAARTKEQAMQTAVTKAENNAKTREIKLQAAADSSRRSAASLRDQIDTISRSIPGLTADAVARYATAANFALGECSERYTAVAADADRLASDRRTLIDAWPK